MTMTNMLRRMEKLEVETSGSGAVTVVFARDDEPAPTPPPGLDQKVIVVRFVRPGFETAETR